MKLVSCLVLSSLAALSASAKEVTNVPEIGVHQTIFTIEKNINPQNVAVIYTKVDEKCRFLTDPANRDQPMFDFYWLMDHRDYKPMNSYFKDEFGRRVTFAQGEAGHFRLVANDLKEMDQDLGAEPTLDVVALAGARCDVQAFINLGPSDANARIRLDTIYGEGRLFPPKMLAVTLKGEVVDKNGKGTGKKVSRRYVAK